MILGFKEKFPDGTLTYFRQKILSCFANEANTRPPFRPKLHTIREDKNNRWKKGMLIHFATGVRTKAYCNFWKDECKATQEIEIIYTGQTDYYPSIYIEGRNLSYNEMTLLAINDGFEDQDDFFKWFNADFSGKIIHWTNLLY